MRLFTIIKIILLVVIGLGTLAVAYYVGYEREKRPPLSLTPTLVASPVPSIVITATPSPTATPIQQQLTPSITPENDFENLLLSLPFHNSSKMLRVYAPEPSLSICTNKEDPYCIAKGLSVWDTSLSLIVYDTKSKSSVFLGNIHPVSTSNSGGLFVPFAITKDNSEIILKAYMGDPGAGGGCTNYGYATIPIKAAPSKDWVVEESRIATSSAYFYDSFGKAVYVDEGDKTPHFSTPNCPNNGAIMFRNLITNENAKKILEEEDTSYEITAVDEKNGVLKFKATKYVFSNDCPREEDGLFCAKNSITERSISLP